jgi:hypothetical protein
MRRISSMGNDYRIETFDLSEEQHDIAVDMVRNNKRKVGNYTLEGVDADMLEAWIDNAKEDGDEEYAEFLREAIEVGAEILTLTDHLGDFSQPIGEVAVYDCVIVK